MDTQNKTKKIFEYEREQAKRFIKKFEDRKEEIKRKQIIEDVKRCREMLKLSFEEWLEEYKKIDNVKGVCL